MCGRLACGLHAEDVCNSCCYKKSENYFTRPQWIDLPDSRKSYKPSYNICPTDVAPVMACGSHFNLDTRIICPMEFGLIPSWIKVGEKSAYSTINCRIETVKTSKLYGGLLRCGQTCVVVCNGFYEWQEKHKGKKAFFIHLQQPENIIVNEPDTWNLEFTPNKGFKGFRCMKLAALFDKKTCSDQIIYSFTIITKEASSEMSWLHTRMPVIIENDEQLEIWMNYKKFDSDYALACLLSKTHVVYYPVSNSVNSHANKDNTCIKRDCDRNESQDGSRKLLSEWLKGGLKRKSEKTEENVIKEKVNK